MMKKVLGEQIDFDYCNFCAKSHICTKHALIYHTKLGRTVKVCRNNWARLMQMCIKG